MDAQKECSQLVQDAREVIHSKYPYLSGSTDIADLLQVSAPHLIRAFTREMGTSPTRYLVAYKLEQAKKLLGTQHLYVDTVANLVGFSCGNYFAKVFKKAYGQTPSQFVAKKQLQATQPDSTEESEDFPELFL